MNAVELKQTLADGGYVFGCMLSAMASPRFAGALSGSTCDYVIIDSEHTSRDRTEIQTLCTMLRSIDIASVVRVPVPKAEWVAMALDAGTSGVLVPYCETVAEVEAVVATARFHPLKGAYLKRAMTEGKLPSDAAGTYLAKRHRHTFVIIGIESEPAYENLDAILSVPGIDGLFIGPNDMSTSLGIPDDYDNPRYQQVVADIIKRAEASGVPVMVHQQTIATSAMAISLGARFVLHSTDAGMLQRAMQSEMNELRALTGRVRSPVDDKVDTI